MKQMLATMGILCIIVGILMLPVHPGFKELVIGIVFVAVAILIREEK